MKKLVAMILVLMVVLPLAGCRASGSIGSKDSSDKTVNV